MYSPPAEPTTLSEKKWQSVGLKWAYIFGSREGRKVNSGLSKSITK